MLFAITNEQKSFENQAKEVTPLTLRQYLNKIKEIDPAPVSSKTDQLNKKQFFITLIDESIIWVQFEKIELSEIESWFGPTLSAQLKYKYQQQKYQ